MWIFQEELAARVAEQQAAVMAAGLLDKKESEDSSTVIGPSMPEPEPPHTEVQLKTAFCCLLLTSKLSRFPLYFGFRKDLVKIQSALYGHSKFGSSQMWQFTISLKTMVY